MDMTEIAQTATVALESGKSAHHRIDELTDKVNDITTLTTAMGRMDEKVDNLKSDVDEIKSDVKVITSRPTNLMESVKTAIIVAIATGIAVEVLNLLFK